MEPPQAPPDDPQRLRREEVAAYREDLISSDPTAAKRLREKFEDQRPAVSAGGQLAPETISFATSPLTNQERATIIAALDAAAATLTTVENHRTRRSSWPCGRRRAGWSGSAVSA